MWVLLLFGVILAIAVSPRVSTRQQAQLAAGAVVVMVALQAVRGHLL